MMGILSIQSQVAAGHVGNSAAAFALQYLGREVWQLPSVLLSHHPGHGGAEGGPLSLDLQKKLLKGLAARGCFNRCEAIISGYLGQAGTADIVRAALARARAAGAAVYLCDPVLGDDGRLYVGHDVVTEMHNLAALADMITPNEYELSLLSGQDFTNRTEALRAMRVLQKAGPGIVVLTGFCGAGTGPDMLEVLALDGAAAWRVEVPRLKRKFSGAGDVFAALFLNFWLPRHDTACALGEACAALHGVLAETAAQGGDELALIPARRKLARPARNFVAERLA